MEYVKFKHLRKTYEASVVCKCSDDEYCIWVSLVNIKPEFISKAPEVKMKIHISEIISKRQTI